MFPIVFHFGSIPIFRHVFSAVFLGGGWVDISSANRSWWVGLIHEFVFRGPSTIIAWLDYSFASPSAGFRTCGFHFCGPNLVSSPIQLSFMMWRCPMRERFSWLCQLFGWLFDVACDVACDWWSDIYNANIKHHDNSEPFWTILNRRDCNAGCLGNLLQHCIYPAAQVLHLTQEGQVPPHNHQKCSQLYTKNKKDCSRLQQPGSIGGTKEDQRSHCSTVFAWFCMSLSVDKILKTTQTKSKTS